MGDDKSPRTHPWSSLSTVTNFDRGNNTPVTVPLNRSHQPVTNRQDVSVRSSHSLLLISMIHQLCAFFEDDSVRVQQLCLVICKQFANHNVIDASYTEDEYEPLRNGYRDVLYQLFNVGRQLIRSEGPLRSPGFLFAEWSRYRREFHEISCIGYGGFGVVYKAVHRVDKAEYAVKKIVVHSDNVDSIKEGLNEVKTIARLNHPNIVPYNSAWIEPSFSATLRPTLPPPESESIVNGSSERRIRSCGSRARRNIRSRNNNVVASSSEDAVYSSNSSSMHNTESQSMELHSESRVEFIDDSNSDCVSFRSDSMEHCIKQYSRSSRSSENSRSSQSTRSSDCDESNNNNKVSCYKSKTTPQPRFTTTLYIQMALCEKTVEAFLDESTERISDSMCVTITEQILCGLEYLHSQNIVHHDIKPSNILILRSDPLRICLADFGLTCSLQTENHQPANGTPLYAAPEQLMGECNPKSDIYSVGIVLWKLLVRPQTHMEFDKYIPAVQRGEIPQNYFPNPRWGRLISRLIQQDPSARPTSTQVLEDLREDKDLIITQLSDENRKKDEEIERLKNALRDLQEENILLKSRQNEDVALRTVHDNLQ